MNEFMLRLTDEERQFLLGLLELARKDTPVEEHRTRKPSYREHIVHRAKLIFHLLDKLGQPVGRSGPEHGNAGEIESVKTPLPPELRPLWS